MHVDRAVRKISRSAGAGATDSRALHQAAWEEVALHGSRMCSMSKIHQRVGVVLGIVLAAFVPGMARAAVEEEPLSGPMPVEFFVSTRGNDAWSGRLPAPGEKDGPFATVTPWCSCAVRTATSS